MGAIPKNIAASTMKHYIRELADNVTTHIPLIKMLIDKGNVKVRGGTSINFPIEYGDSTACKSYEGYDPLPLSDDDFIDQGEVRWARYNQSIQYSDDDEAFNSGEEAIIDFVESRTKNAERSLKKTLAAHCMLDGSGNNSKDLYGIPYWVREDPTTSVAVAGINQSTSTWWQNQHLDNTTIGAWGSATNKYGRQAFDSMAIDLQRNEEFPDAAFTDKTSYKKLKKEYELSEIYQIGSRSGKEKKVYGSRGFEVDGVEVLFDNSITNTTGTDGTMYLLNTNYMKFYIHAKKNFVFIPAMRPTNTASYVSHIRVYLNLVCTNRAMQGVIYNIA